jgi:hypothetical protein
MPSNDRDIQKKREHLIKLVRSLFVQSYVFSYLYQSIFIMCDRVWMTSDAYVYRHCVKMTAAKARLHPEIWLTARLGICSRIIGYQTLVEQGNKAAADYIATSADTCNNICIAYILFIHCVRSNYSVLMSLSCTECSFIHSVGRFAQVDEKARCHSENIRQHQSWKIPTIICSQSYFTQKL